MSTTSDTSDIHNNHTPSPTSISNTTNQSQSSSYLHSQSLSREQPNFFKRFSKSLNLFKQQPSTFATETVDQHNTSESPSSGLKRLISRLLGKRNHSNTVTVKKMDSGDRAEQNAPDGSEQDRPNRDGGELPNVNQNSLNESPMDYELDFESRVAEFFPDSLYRDIQHNTNHLEETTQSTTQANFETTQPQQPGDQAATNIGDNQSTDGNNTDDINSSSTNTNDNESNQTNPDTNTNNATSDAQTNTDDPLLGADNNNDDTDTHNRAIVITVNYLFSDQNRPDNPNRSGSLVLSLPNNTNNRDPNSIQEFIRIATQMAYTLVMNGLQNQPRGITLDKFELFEKMNVRHFDEDDSKVCSICFEDFDDLVEEGEEEEEEEDDGQASVDDELENQSGGNKEEDKEGYVVRKRRRLVNKTSRLFRRFSRSHTEAIEDGERRTPNVSETSSVSDYATPFASNNSSVRPNIGTPTSSNNTSPTTNRTQPLHQPQSTTQAAQTAHTAQTVQSGQTNQGASRPVYLIDVKDPFGHSPIKMPCNHIFGQDCLSEWLKLHSTCPLCRYSVAEPVASEGANTSRGGSGGSPVTGSGLGSGPVPGLFQGVGLPQAQHQQINGQNYTFYTIPHESLPDLDNNRNNVGGGNVDDVTQANFANRLALLLRPALMGQTNRQGGVAGASVGRDDATNDAASDAGNPSIEPLLRVMQQAREARERMVRGETGENNLRSTRRDTTQSPTYIQALRNQGERPFARLRDTSPGFDERMTPIGGSGLQGDEERTTRSRSINTGFRDRMRNRNGHHDEDQERSRSFLPGYSEIMNYIRNGFSGLRNTSSRLNGDHNSDNDDREPGDFETRRRHEMTLHPGGLVSMRTANGIETFTDEEVERMLNRQDGSVGEPTLRPQRRDASANVSANANANANASASASASANGGGGDEDNQDVDEPLGLIDDDEIEEGRRDLLDSLSYHRRNYR